MNSEKEKFSQRLNIALDEAGFPGVGEGRRTLVADALGVRAELVEQWLKGEAFPNTSKLVKLAQMIRVRSNWLLLGAGEKYSSELDDEEFREKLKFKHAETKRVRSQIASQVNISESGLTKEAVEIACAYMKLSAVQRVSVFKFVMRMASEH